jgi:hypothetical protein
MGNDVATTMHEPKAIYLGRYGSVPSSPWRSPTFCRSIFISRLRPADALLYFIVAGFVTNILTPIMILELSALPRPIPSSDTTPKLSSLNCHE